MGSIQADARQAVSVGWRAGHHVLDRCEDRGIDVATVMAACVAPDVTYAHGRKYPGQYRYIRNGVVAVVDPAKRRVVTVYHNVDWTDAATGRAVPIR